jgi:hypothetical protein
MKITNSNYSKLIKYIGVVVVVLLSNISKAQLDYNWVFGKGIGLNFSDKDSIKWIKSKMEAYHRDNPNKPNDPYIASAHSTQNDCNGNVLFYTNRQFIYDKNGIIIPNSLLDTINPLKFFGGGTGNSNILTLPIPKNKNRYLLVYSDYFDDPPWNILEKVKFNGMKYAEIEQNPMDSSWKINYKDRPFGPKIIGSSNLTYIKHADNERIWVLFPKNKDTILTYLLDSNGFTSAPVYNSAKTVTASINDKGRLPLFISGMIKASHSGDLLCSVGYNLIQNPSGNNAKNNQFFLYDFDRTTGKLSNEKPLFKSQFPPGKKWEKSMIVVLEFSPNDSFIYLGFASSAANVSEEDNTLSVWRYSVSNASFTNLKELNRTNSNFYMAMQIGADGKIYIFGKNIVFRLNTPNEKYYNAEIFADTNTTGYKTNWLLRVVQNAYTLSNRAFLPQRPALQENCIDSSVFHFSGDTLAYKLVWKFGDGDSLVQKTPIPWFKPIKHKYPLSGTYPVELHAYFTECNFHKVVYDTLNVKLKPILKQYSVTQAPACLNDTFKWKLSISHADSAYVWANNSLIHRLNCSKLDTQFITWTCNDTNIQHIKFEFFNQYGCRFIVLDTLKPQWLPHPKKRWNVNQQSINAFLNAPIQGCSPLTLNFEYQKDSISKTELWAFNLDTLHFNGNRFSLILTDSTYQNYDLKLKYHNAYGCYALDSLKARVFPPLNLDIDFYTPSNCLKNNQFRLENKTYSNTDSVWVSWGDETHSSWNSNKISHIFNEIGTYPITIFATSKYGCSDTVNQEISIHEQAKPDFKFSSSSSCLNNNKLLFETNNSSYIFNVHWGDGTSDLKIGSGHTHHFNTPGSFDVQLIIQTPFNCIDTFYHQIIILQPSINRWITTTDKPCIGDTLSFTNASEFPSQQEKLGSTFYLINKNQRIDSFPSYNTIWKTAAHNAGNWRYLFVLKSPDGCLDSFTASGYTHAPTPVAYKIENICPENPLKIQSSWAGSLQFMNLDIPSISFQKQFPNPVNIWVSKPHFLSTGIYPIFITTQNEFGCVEYDSVSVVVHPSPVAKFGYEELSYNPEGSQLQLLDSSTNAVSWRWNIANQEFPQIPNPQTLIPANENIGILLSVESEFDCLDSTQKYIFIEHPIQFSFPTAITVNKDGLNEYFMTSESAWIKEIDVKIYNRWGELVFMSKDPNFKWNSPYLEVFTYLIKIKDINNKKHYLKGTCHVLK